LLMDYLTEKSTSDATPRPCLLGTVFTDGRRQNATHRPTNMALVYHPPSLPAAEGGGKGDKHRRFLIAHVDARAYARIPYVDVRRRAQ
jgi:hypothetical protein